MEQNHRHVARVQDRDEGGGRRPRMIDAIAFRRLKSAPVTANTATRPGRRRGRSNSRLIIPYYQPPCLNIFFCITLSCLLYFCWETDLPHLIFLINHHMKICLPMTRISQKLNYCTYNTVEFFLYLCLRDRFRTTWLSSTLKCYFMQNYLSFKTI